MICW